MHSQLNLTFGYHRGQTRLTNVKADSVFKVTRPVSLPDGSGLQLILMSPAPGIFGGDLWEIDIKAESGTKIHLTTQGALRVHPSRNSDLAEQKLRYILQSESNLTIYTEPVIPFANSQFNQLVQLEVESGAKLGFWESFMAGRLAHGEAWHFQMLESETKLFLDKTLQYLDRFRLCPNEEVLQHPFRLGTFKIWASALMYLPNTFVTPTEWPKHSEVAIDELMPNLHLLRCLAEDGQVLRQVQYHWLNSLSKKDL
jgi:urease accessory protein